MNGDESIRKVQFGVAGLTVQAARGIQNAEMKEKNAMKCSHRWGGWMMRWNGDES